MNTTKHVAVSIALALIVTAASYLVAFQFGLITQPNYLEIFAVATSYSCTYLCVQQSRMNYPIGVASTMALTLLFWQQGYYASAALNLYLTPALIVGWMLWGKDSNPRPVTHLAMDRWIWVYALITVSAITAVTAANSYFGSTVAQADAIIFVCSVLAQILLDTKKIETWFVWIPVNVFAIWVYHETLPLVAFQFVFFLGNAVYGYVSWRRTMPTAQEAF